MENGALDQKENQKVLPANNLDFFSPFLPRYKSVYLQIVKKILVFFEYLFGIKIFLEIPEQLHQFNPNTWEVLKLAYLLKKSQIFNFISREKTETPEDIPIIRYKIKMTAGSDLFGDAHGYNIDDEKLALQEALRNALKLYSLHKFYPKKNKFRIASLKELGTEVLNLNTLTGIEEGTRQKGHPMFCINFDENTSFRWIKGISYKKNSPIWIPFQLVNAVFQRTHREEPILRFAGTAGMGVSQNYFEALHEGLLDLIERDACMITWLNKLTPPLINISSIRSTGTSTLIQELQLRNLNVHISVLPTDIPVNVVLMTIIDQTGIGPAVSVASGSDYNIENAIKKALTKILAVRGSSIKQKMQKEFNITNHSTASTDISIKKFSNIGRRGRVFFWSRQIAIPEIEFLIKGDVKNENSFKDYLPQAKTPKEKFQFLLKAMKEKTLEVVYIEATPKRLLNTNIKIYSVFVPELQPMHSEESLPYNSGSRLLEVPKKLGYKPAEKLNVMPHPFYTI